jgi:hypothetical protein
MHNRIERLSKSQYLKGLQCPKALWLHRHRPNLAPPISEQKQWLFDSGHEVGTLAQAYFENGHLIDEPYYETDKAIDSTNRSIADDKNVIFEATASSPDGAYSRIDILKKITGTVNWDLIEVKQSTGIKDYHLDDIALQRYAFQGAGYDIRRSILMHLNRDYIRRGELDPKNMFLLEDCTDWALSRMAGIASHLSFLLDIINQPDEPSVSIGRHCRSPFECDYMGYCWQHVPEYSVFNVFRGAKLDGLLAAGILDVSELPAGFPLTERQQIEINAYKNRSVHVDRHGIGNFLNTLKYPLYYLDYETIFPAIPLFDNSSPYQQIPFQFSLHTQQKRGGELTHAEFLHSAMTDPRPDFVSELIEDCGTDGSVIVYNMGFESRINRELSVAFPHHAAELEKINSRMVDLLVPFRNRYLYHPEMLGSASIKSVLPAFVLELTYDELEISDGDMASRNYLKCLKNMVSDDAKSEIYDNLRQYCKMDTYAEVRLIEKLYEFSGN